MLSLKSIIILLIFGVIISTVIYIRKSPEEEEKEKEKKDEIYKWKQEECKPSKCGLSPKTECIDKNNQIVDSNKCDIKIKPQVICPNCEYEWKIGDWTSESKKSKKNDPCNNTNCGTNWQRNISCLNKTANTTDIESSCNSEIKPDSNKKCKNCEYEWKTDNWKGTDDIVFTDDPCKELGTNCNKYYTRNVNCWDKIKNAKAEFSINCDSNKMPVNNIKCRCCGDCTGFDNSECITDLQICIGSYTLPNSRFMLIDKDGNNLIYNFEFKRLLIQLNDTERSLNKKSFLYNDYRGLIFFKIDSLSSDINIFTFDALNVDYELLPDELPLINKPFDYYTQNKRIMFNLSNSNTEGYLIASLMDSKIETKSKWILIKKEEDINGYLYMKKIKSLKKEDIPNMVYLNCKIIY
jgi:hypothetical protein